MEPAIEALIPDWLFSALGWVPAIIFPAASGLQLLAILSRRSAAGVSIPAWTLFAVANVCLFVYTEKYDEIESIVGALGTSLLNVCIVLAALRYRDRAPRPAADGASHRHPPTE